MFEPTAARAQHANAFGYLSAQVRQPEHSGHAAPAAAASKAFAMNPMLSGWIALALDQVDYGLMLIADDREIVHLNRVARAELDEWPTQPERQQSACCRLSAKSVPAKVQGLKPAAFSETNSDSASGVRTCLGLFDNYPRDATARRLAQAEG